MTQARTGSKPLEGEGRSQSDVSTSQGTPKTASEDRGSRERHGKDFSPQCQREPAILTLSLGTSASGTVRKYIYAVTSPHCRKRVSSLACSTASEQALHILS